MANFSQANYETPDTGVDLDWGKVPRKKVGTTWVTWHPDVVALYNSIKDNEFSKFFYQTDVYMIRLLCEQHSQAFLNPDMTAAGWKVIYDQWDKFGLTMRSRANIRYTLAQTAAQEDYTSEVKGIIENAFQGSDD